MIRLSFSWFLSSRGLLRTGFTGMMGRYLGAKKPSARARVWVEFSGAQMSETALQASHFRSACVSGLHPGAGGTPGQLLIRYVAVGNFFGRTKVRSGSPGEPLSVHVCVAPTSRADGTPGRPLLREFVGQSFSRVFRAQDGRVARVS